jgi:predicted DNA-binding protein
MGAATTQISANVSLETKDRLEKYASEFGVKKSHLIETALLHHLNALEDLPFDVIISPVLVVTRRSGKKMLRQIESPAPPTEAIEALFNDQDSDQ